LVRERNLKTVSRFQRVSAVPSIIPLTRGQQAIVDTKYHKALMDMGRWSYNPKGGYAQKRCKATKRIIQMHRVVCQLAGKPLGPRTDHRNCNGLDNRSRNLRPATHRENTRNVRRRRDNQSGYKGVSWHKSNSTWVAQIRVNDRPKHLGCFTDKVEAAKAYDKAAKKLYGKFARLNFPRKK
jgi:hypothetical protein